MRAIYRSVVFLSFLLGENLLAALADPEETVQPSLIADTSAVVPGRTFHLALHLKIAPGWHTYGENPGDSGLPIRIEWQLPRGFHAGPIKWPPPREFSEPGGLKTSGYTDEVLLSSEISVPSTVTEPELAFSANANWLACEKLCVPGAATVSLRLPVSATAAPVNIELFERFRSAPAHAAPRSPLAHFLLFGFLGGLILNVMPCVLPVIALKIFGLIKQAGESPAKIFRLGLAFIAGVFAWFLGLALLVVAFKSAGHELNWAFQFQNRWVLIAMIFIVGIFALNLLGLFEVFLPGRVNTRLAALSGREGYVGAFLHGVFATLMATPCTAPFLAPALGFAFTQTPAVIFAIFAAIAAGMSAPYLLLTAQPRWMRFLPRPGIWMVRLKQSMGVLLLVTAVWLIWVLQQQTATVSRESFLIQLERARSQPQIVFVDFTAQWCLNCKVNERFVLNAADVQRLFAREKVVLLKADWTNGDPEITALLKSFGRVGVPLYVVYPADRSAEPIVLPEILTAPIVIEAIAAARAKSPALNAPASADRSP